MTREQAAQIMAIQKPIRGTKEKIEAYEMAIKALEQEPCGKDINVPATDAISRQAVLDGVDRYIYKSQSTGTQDDFYSFAELVVKQLPSVTPQPKTGHWSRKTKVDAYDIAGVKTWGIKCQCDRCDFTTIVVEDFGYYKYCPNCGAKMESEDEE